MIISNYTKKKHTDIDISTRLLTRNSWEQLEHLHHIVTIPLHFILKYTFLFVSYLHLLARQWMQNESPELSLLHFTH